MFSNTQSRGAAPVASRGDAMVGGATQLRARPEQAAQLKMQEAANNSPQVTQLKALQRKANPIQMVKGGRGSDDHHKASQKSHLNAGQAAGQTASSQQALGYIQQGMSRKEARRQANTDLGLTARGKSKK